MIRQERYARSDLKRIQQACCHVFMHAEALRPHTAATAGRAALRFPFLETLTWEQVQKAYRSNVLRYHPDRHQDKPYAVIERLGRHMEKVNHAYEYLAACFGRKSPCPSEELCGAGRIIAVGGAKGGIGKSILTANMGMLMAESGLKTVVVDLDLGGSDLHIYLGERVIPHVTLNDYLNRKHANLEDVVLRRPNRPHLIAGNSSEVGSANIPFMRKKKLLENLRKLGADYIILDLGGGTDYNTLDFFLAADTGIVVTTLDQPAYIEAYAFIKTALQRKLRGLFMADSTFICRDNHQLKDIVYACTEPADEHHPRTIEDLLISVHRNQPLSLPLIADEILGFSPYLVVNRCFDPQAAGRVVYNLTGVALRRLSINVTHLGSVGSHRELEQATSYLHHPVAARKPGGGLVHDLSTILRRLELFR
ncbi:MAG: AAA family ATPase [Deltaproteobacteria bacterium]|nr:AAA family ATPase [Deltaproteobacteria bacterium]